MAALRKRVSPGAHQLSTPGVLPYGGDVAVAQSIADIHRENPWTGRCLACNDPSPCLERRYANAVLIHSGREPRRHRLTAALTVVIGASLGMLLIAVGLVGFLW
jgi:hypothetical protein